MYVARQMSEEQVSDIFAAVGHPNRLAILCCLAPHSQGEDSGGLPAGEIARRLEMAPATLSFHLKELSRNNILSSSRKGRNVFYRVDIPALLEALEFMVNNVCEAASSDAR